MAFAGLHNSHAFVGLNQQLQRHVADVRAYCSNRPAHQARN